MIGPIAGISTRNVMNNAFSSICRNNDNMFSSIGNSSLSPLSCDTVSFSSNLSDCDNLQNSVKYQVANANEDAIDKFKSYKIKHNAINLIA